ncbi:unnamed protein product [Trypanosoma congolense IL3000]|uniref:WGS project CAEQ00000000 data, annotated contig 1187 n=1 Tax=Trypanosoma congolense (strain IL3000) TaxID=1068625 RepID=F9W4I5_TRYCI|nr:unnamed protein product [Trypanosoma congolense IL3000]
MRWSISRNRIKCPKLKQLLQQHKEIIDAESVLWLSRAQARCHYRLHCRGGLKVPRDVFPTPGVYSLNEYSRQERRNLLRLLAPPTDMCHKWLLLTRNCAGLTWEPATVEQYAEALLASPATDSHFDGTLLIDAAVAVPSHPQREVLIFNAQEISNPFLIDSSLQHKHFTTGQAFSHGVGSSLSTIWSQFSYTSMRWLPSDDAEQLTGVSPKSGQSPHSVLDPEPIRLFHLEQITEEARAAILRAAPRWVMTQSLTKSVILSGGRWLTWRRMELNDDVGPRHASRGRRGEQTRDLPLLRHGIWLHDTDNTPYAGAPLRRYRMRQRLFYNSSQLAV